MCVLVFGDVSLLFFCLGCSIKGVTCGLKGVFVHVDNGLACGWGS